MEQGGALPLPVCPAALAEVWSGASSLLRVVNIVDEAPDVKTFIFEPERPALFRYKAGQFLTLELPTQSGALLRTYTIASTPSRPMTVSVTVKCQVGSVGTRWMFENLSVGGLLHAIGPAGTFTLDLSRRQKQLFISAGSGITPMMSMIRWMSDVLPGADVTFLHCARSPSDIIFRDELAVIARSMHKLRIGYIVEKGAAGWTGVCGRLDIGRLESLSPDFLEREIFCCGPEPFMNGVQSVLDARGFAPDHYHQEAFTFAAPITQPIVSDPPVNRLKSENSLSETPIRFLSSELEGMAGADETVLGVARRCGVRILSVCEIGLCGTCKVRKTAGDVDMQHNGGITDDEIQEGYILACCSKPLSALEIEA
ncbi:FAD-binding oxidoreductase [Sinorhizobium meliloti]|uniref:2Fe-2S iron-sulfur cluster-binding protein n=1 Tax=Rhizobium meliloti TaxID=382 RepID=UPI0013E3829B